MPKGAILLLFASLYTNLCELPKQITSPDLSFELLFCHLLQYISTSGSHRLFKFNMPKLELISRPLQRLFQSRIIEFSWEAYWYGILVSSGCYNKIPQTMWLNQYLLLTVLEATKSKNQGASRFGIWWKPCSWLEDGLLTVSSHDGERKNKFYGHFFGTIPIVRVPPSWPHLNLITSQRPHSLMPSHWGLGLQHINCEGYT